MRDFEVHEELNNNIKIHQEQNQKQEYKFIGSITIRRGLKLFAYNPGDDEINEVKISSKNSKIELFSGDVIKNREAQYNPKYIYFQALNHKNARRKLMQYRAGLHTIAEGFEQKEFEKLP